MTFDRRKLPHFHESHPGGGGSIQEDYAQEAANQLSRWDSFYDECYNRRTEAQALIDALDAALDFANGIRTALKHAASQNGEKAKP